jgi:hypothetical protein
MYLTVDFIVTHCQGVLVDESAVFVYRHHHHHHITMVLHDLGYIQYARWWLQFRDVVHPNGMYNDKLVYLLLKVK